MAAVFETERLILREWTIEDAEAAFAIYGDPEVTRYLGSTGEPDPSLAYRREPRSETDDQRLAAIKRYLAFGFLPRYENDGEDLRPRWSAVFQAIGSRGLVR